MLVGRALELGTLNSSFDSMLSGVGSVLFIAGEAGLGKTTLVYEWWKTVTPDAATFAAAACSIPIGNVDVGMLEALQPWADIVATLQSSDIQAKKKFDLKKLIHDAAPAWAWAIPVVGEIAHAAVETAQAIKEQRGGTATAMNQQQVFQQYVNLLTKVAEETPLVILLDDMHWADTSSTNLLFYLSRQISGKKILVLATYRPDEAAIAYNGKGHPMLKVKNEIFRYETGKEISLAYLGEHAIRELLTTIFADYVVDEIFERWLLKISDGNSLFITQFIKTLREDGWLNDYGTFSGNYTDITIPATALAVVEERTQRLDPETRELLRYATAEGEEFTSYVLGQLTNKKPLELLQELRKAESTGMIKSKGSARIFSNQTTMIFGYSHSLFHKVLYDSLFEQEKEILHKQCFQVLKTEWEAVKDTSSSVSTIASKLLLHAEKSNEQEYGAHVALRTAREMWKKFSSTEALEMIETVQRFANFPGVTFEKNTREELIGTALLLKAKILFMHSRLSEAMGTVTDALVNFERIDNQWGIMRGLLDRANLHGYLGKLDASEADAQLGLALAEKIGKPEELANGYEEVAKVYNLSGKYEESLLFFSRSLELYKSIGDIKGTAVTLNNIGNEHSSLGAVEEALQCYEQSLTLSESLNDHYLKGWSLSAMAKEYHHLHKDDIALEYFQRSTQMMEISGNVFLIGNNANTIGAIYHQRGMHEKALEYFSQAIEIAKTTGSQTSHAAALNNASHVYRDRKEFEQARQCITEACSLAREAKSKYIEAYAIAQMGLLAEAEADSTEGENHIAKLNEAATYLEESLVILRSIKHRQAKDFEKNLHNVKEKLQNRK